MTENFTRDEFQCKHCGANLIDARLVQRLQVVRDIIGRPITINSGYRCPDHNLAVGGGENSLHVRGMAADITCENIAEVAGLLYNWSGGFHYYPEKNIIHADIGLRRRW